MQTAVRAAIMLAVLVGLPAAWLYYGPLPPQAQRVVDRLVAATKEAVDWEMWTAASEAGEAVRVASNVPIRTASVPPVPAPAAPALSLAVRVEPMLQQLRAWDAAGYQLEPWGSGGRWFRFSCEMPLVEGAAATQLFEAVAADPLDSIQRVVADVETWRATRLTAMR